MSLLEEYTVDCPYCGKRISALIDPSVDYQEYYEDCSLCCSPILFLIRCENDAVTVDIKRDDE